MVYDVVIHIISLIDIISCEVESILLSLFYFYIQESEVRTTRKWKSWVRINFSTFTQWITQQLKRIKKDISELIVEWFPGDTVK